MGKMKGRADSSRRLTIAHFMPWSEIGGVEVATIRLIDATSHQFRHVAFCLPDAISLKNTFKELGIETITYVPPTPSLRHGVSFYRASLAIARQITLAKTDIVHFADREAAEHNSLAALIARVQTVCHIRSTYTHLSLRQRLSLLLVRNFIFVSKESRRGLAKYFPDSKTRVIYDAVEAPDFDIPTSNKEVRNELGIPLEDNLVGMVARVAPVKDYYTLILAATKVLARYPNTRFLIVGDNSRVDLNRRHYQEVVQKLREAGIEDKFLFTGHRNDVPRLIAAMDICVLCSHREGLPLSILESMAMQKPVVATAVGGIPEVIESGVTGYLHQPGNSDELASAIISLIEDSAKASRIGLTAREHVQQNYSRQIFIDEISQAYSDITDS